MKNRHLPTVRRTREQIRKDVINYSNCSKCGEQLIRRTKIRDKPKMCQECRGNATSGNSQIRKLLIEFKKNPTEASEDEIFFQDDPVAIKEEDNARYIAKPTEVSFGVSDITDMMTKTNYYNPYNPRPVDDKNRKKRVYRKVNR